MLGTSIYVQRVWSSSVGLERQGLPGRRDVPLKPPVTPSSRVTRLALSGSVSLREDTVFQAQDERACPCLDPLASPFVLSVGPTELPPQSWIQKHNGFM